MSEPPLARGRAALQLDELLANERAASTFAANRLPVSTRTLTRRRTPTVTCVLVKH